MNALTMSSLAAIILLLVWIALWFVRRGKAEGASEKEIEDGEKVHEMLKNHIERSYNGKLGTDDFSVRDERPWKPTTRT